MYHWTNWLLQKEGSKWLCGNHGDGEGAGDSRLMSNMSYFIRSPDGSLGQVPSLPPLHR